jgi:hypothetical protein
MQFSEIVGKTLLLRIPRLAAERYFGCELVGVESMGLWIKSQDLTNLVLQAAGVPSSARTPVFFVPFQEISLAMSSIPEMALEEKAFGV